MHRLYEFWFHLKRLMHVHFDLSLRFLETHCGRERVLLSQRYFMGVKSKVFLVVDGEPLNASLALIVNDW